MIEAKWFKAWKGDTRYLPKSQRDGIQKTQEILAPLQAFIALVSGNWEGDMKALVEVSRQGKMFCDACDKVIATNGSGHSADCELYTQAQAVLSSGVEYEQRRLEAEQAGFLAKAAKKQEQLDRLRARKNNRGD